MSLIQKTGSLSARMWKMSFQGNLSFLEREFLKKELAGQIKSIQNLTPKEISSDSILYTADIKQGSFNGVDDIKQVKVKGFKLIPYQKAKDFIVIQVKKHSLK